MQKKRLPKQAYIKNSCDRAAVRAKSGAGLGS
jgi:hypothetical protein